MSRNNGKSKFADSRRTRLEPILSRKEIFIRLFLLISLIAFVVFLLQERKPSRFSDLKEGSFSQETIKAPFTFPIYKSKDQIDKERSAEQKSVPFAFDAKPEIAALEIARLEELFDLFSELRGLDRLEYTDSDGNPQLYVSPSFDSLKIILKENFEINVSEDRWQMLVTKNESLSDKELGIFRDELVKILTDTYQTGVLSVEKAKIESPIIKVRDGNEDLIEHVRYFNDPAEARKQALDRLKEKYQEDPPGTVNIGYEILSEVLEPNIIFNGELTQHRKSEAYKSVSQINGYVIEGETIVSKNEIITADILQKLLSFESALGEKNEQETSWAALDYTKSIFGKIVVVLICFSFLFFYLYFYQREVFFNNRYLLLMFLILAAVFIADYVTQLAGFSKYLVPIAIPAMLLTILFDFRVGFMITFTLAILLGILNGNDFSLILVTMFAGGVAGATVTTFRRRSQVFTSMVLVVAAYLVSLTALSMLNRDGFSEFFYENTVYALINGALSPIIVFGLIVLFERAFDIATELSLVELSDSNHPLLQQLALKAPGTYHHSIIVGNLAKAAAERIGANALLARIGSLYHDIGKMDKPEYFVENQMGARNKHEKLSPRMSVLILISHIKTGLELADKYKLPQAIKDFIAEHHGTSLMPFFYHKAIEEKGEEDIVNESDFRYPGPKPDSRESGIVMLADSVEAAIHSIKEPNANRIRAMVESIVESKLKEGELDECQLTMSDMKQITESFMPILLGIYHVRVEYPNQEKRLKKETA